MLETIPVYQTIVLFINSGEWYESKNQTITSEEGSHDDTEA